jgi:hypothetical protein
MLCNKAAAGFQELSFSSSLGILESFSHLHLFVLVASAASAFMLVYDAFWLESNTAMLLAGKCSWKISLAR